MKRILMIAMIAFALGVTATSHSAGSVSRTVPPPLCPPFCR